MGKRLIVQRRGRGTPTYKAPSHKYKGEIKHRAYDDAEKTGQVTGTVMDILHDPGRSAPIAQVKFINGEERLILVSEGLRVGDEISCGISAPIKQGNTLPLTEIPEGTPVYNIELSPGDGGKIAKSSGVYALLITHDVNKSVVQLPSGTLKTLNPRCRATIGVVAGGGRLDKPLMKAGKMYHKISSKAKLWPTVRGVAMNHHNHPHGGGNRQHPGRPTCVSRNAPPGAKVGLIAPRRTGKR